MGQKIQKLSKVDVNEFPISLTILNIDTFTYHLAKYLLSTLSASEYTVKSTKVFVQKVTVKVSQSHQMISFIIKSLITNVPSE